MSDAPWRSSQNEHPLEVALIAAMRAEVPPQGSRERTVARLTGWAPLVAVMLFAKRTLACHAPWFHAGVGALAVGGAVAGIAAIQQPSAQSQVEPPSGAVGPVQNRTPHESPAAVRSGSAHRVSNPGSSAPREQHAGSPPTVTSAEVAGASVSSIATPAPRARAPRSSEALEAEVAALYGVRSGLKAGLPSLALERLERQTG